MPHSCLSWQHIDLLMADYLKQVCGFNTRLDFVVTDNETL